MCTNQRLERNTKCLHGAVIHSKRVFTKISLHYRTAQYPHMLKFKISHIVGVVRLECILIFLTCANISGVDCVVHSGYKSLSLKKETSDIHA